MAIISIPTSIGGITIPGLNKGPLSSLYGNPFSSSSLQYPSDLGSANKSHMVRFEIREIESYEFGTGQNQINLNASTEAERIAAINGVADKLEEKYNQTKGKTFSEIASPKLKPKSVATINLYMPDSLEFQSSIGYGQKDLLEAALGVVGTVGGKVGAGLASAVDSAIKSSATQIALKNFGYAINPQMQLIFESIDFREYSMSFVFSPNSKQEAQNIQNIIKLFRGWSAPQIVPDTKGMFYRPPAVFDVSFYSDGRENTKINRIKQSVIKSVDVNYAPNGWAAHTNGMPVQTTMTLQLQETVLIDRDQILANGY